MKEPNPNSNESLAESLADHEEGTVRRIAKAFIRLARRQRRQESLPFLFVALGPDGADVKTARGCVSGSSIREAQIHLIQHMRDTGTSFPSSKSEFEARWNRYYGEGYRIAEYGRRRKVPCKYIEMHTN